MPTGHRAMFAAIVVEILVFAAVRFPFHALITIHSNTAYGTLYNAGQQVSAFVFPFVDVFIPFGLSSQLDLCCLPYILGDNGLMQTIHQQKVFLFYQTVLISGSMHLFGFSPAIGNLTAVNRIFQNHADQTGIKKRVFPVLALDFADPMVFKIFCNSICAGIGCNILLIDGANRRSFLLVDFQLAIHQFIAVGGKAAVPLALSGLLDTTFHGLDTDVFTLNFRHCR